MVGLPALPLIKVGRPILGGARWGEELQEVSRLPHPPIGVGGQPGVGQAGGRELQADGGGGDPSGVGSVWGRGCRMLASRYSGCYSNRSFCSLEHSGCWLFISIELDTVFMLCFLHQAMYSVRVGPS